jgi:iron(III) transport system substrate-binding protein
MAPKAGWGTAALVLVLCGLTFAQAQPAAPAAPPEGYPRDYPATVQAARREGTVVVYGATDLAAAAPLIEDFRALYPGLTVDYHDLNSSELHQRFLDEMARGAPSADVLWSSAMDLQVKLVNDGHALRYASPEAESLPEWAVWKREAYGSTLEPVGLAYDKRQVAPAEVPRTHRDFAQLLAAHPERFKGRVITYDLEQSGLGFLFATQDEKASNLVWNVADALGRNRVREVASTSAMLDSLASGESALGYNLLGSYAHARLRRDDSIGFVYPQDYTLVGSRIVFINRRAAHPNAARLWLDHLLSLRGQTVLANRSGLFALRADVKPEAGAAPGFRAEGAPLKPIAIGPSLMANLDRAKRQAFLSRWKQALSGTQ